MTSHQSSSACEYKHIYIHMLCVHASILSQKSTHCATALGDRHPQYTVSDTRRPKRIVGYHRRSLPRRVLTLPSLHRHRRRSLTR